MQVPVVCKEPRWREYKSWTNKSIKRWTRTQSTLLHCCPQILGTLRDKTKRKETKVLGRKKYESGSFIGTWFWEDNIYNKPEVVSGGEKKKISKTSIFSTVEKKLCFINMFLDCRGGKENSCNTGNWYQAFCSFVAYSMYFSKYCHQALKLYFFFRQKSKTTTKIKHLSSLQKDLKNNIQFGSGVQTKCISRTHLIPTTPYSKHLPERAKATAYSTTLFSLLYCY